MLGIDYFPKTRREYMKGYKAWQKQMRLVKRYIDQRCSKEPLKSREDIEEAILTVMHLKGAYVPTWHEYRHSKMYPTRMKDLKKMFFEAVAEIKESA